MNGEDDLWLKLAAAVLAVWRLTHLLAYEDGPGAVLARLRARLGASALGGLMDCFYCLSLWLAAPVSLWLSRAPVEACLFWWAISGGACLCERMAPGSMALSTWTQDDVPRPRPRTEDARPE